MTEPDFYKTLQVDPAADPEVIEVAYRRLARKFHPDTNPAPDATARMAALNEAYAVLAIRSSALTTICAAVWGLASHVLRQHPLAPRSR